MRLDHIYGLIHNLYNRISTGCAPYSNFYRRVRGDRREKKIISAHSAFSAVRTKVFGDSSGEETPVPIPNTAVKLTSADGTNLYASWESRSLPRLI